MDWQPMETARKDCSTVLAKTRDDLPEHCSLWRGKVMPVRHPGLASDGFDMGWNVSLPVGHGGFPDDWFVGWVELPA